MRIETPAMIAVVTTLRTGAFGSIGGKVLFSQPPMIGTPVASTRQCGGTRISTPPQNVKAEIVAVP